MESVLGLGKLTRCFIGTFNCKIFCNFFATIASFTESNLAQHKSEKFDIYRIDEKSQRKLSLRCGGFLISLIKIPLQLFNSISP